MIPKAELLKIAGERSLRPDVVEKDYALGWILAGISAHPALRDEWVFKGGTCLKKCYFETYRFSEDLDFTLRDGRHLDEVFLKRVFGEISEWVYDQAGIEMPVEQQSFEIIANPRRNPACQGKVAYKGPISPRSLPRVKLDLTADERIVMPPVRAAVYHPYSDAPPNGIDVLTYTYEEAFGEKVRALAERTRPRDLYDVINLFRNDANLPDSAVLRDVITQKCEFKGIPFPTLDLIQGHRDELAGSWEAMLGHQLPTLPDLETFLDGLPEFFSWLEGERRPDALQAYPNQAGATLIRERTLPAAVPLRARPALEIIRFAAANRLCVDLTYRPENGVPSTRRIEPYSLRQSQAGDVLLMAVRRDNGQPRSYRTDRIISVSITSESFTPRYEIELSPQSVASAPMVSNAGSVRTRHPRTIRAPASRGRRKSVASNGPTYVYQCLLCQKTFRRKKQASRLNPHKAPGGYPCSGRTGFLKKINY